MKVLWVSDAPWHVTGYGVTTRQVCKRMVEDGHTVFAFAPGAFTWGETTTKDGIIVCSALAGDDRWGNKTLQYHLKRLQPDVIITWLDAHGLVAYGLDTYPLWIWAPIDTWPVPEQEMSILGRADRVLVPSKWGQQVLAKQGIKANYVPCGYSPDDFYPDPEGRKEWRRDWGIDEDTFVIGMVGLNTGSPDRNSYGYAFDILANVHERYPEAKAYIHTNPEGDGGAINLRELAKTLGLEEMVIFPPQIGPEGWPVRYMRHAYNGMDVLLHTSLTEGFGLPVVEAQACGTPVVVNSATSVSELVRYGRAVLPGPPLWINTSTRIATPDVQWMTETLNEYLGNYQGVRLQDDRAVSDLYEQRIYEDIWRPLLEQVPPPLEVAPEGSRRLVLGAGSDQKEGCVHHDKEKFYPHIDVVHDLDVLPWPWEDGSWDYVEMSDVIEHLHAGVTEVMDELWRIVAPGGHIFLHVPKAGSWQHTTDPTHTRAFELKSFDYYDPETEYGRQYRYTEKGWRIIKRTIDPSGGILLVMQTRKPVPAIEPEREAVLA